MASDADELRLPVGGEPPAPAALSRRALLAGAGLGLLSALLPAPAMAYPGLGTGWYYLGGGSNGGVMYNGRAVGYVNGWQADWLASSTWARPQRLRVALGLELSCDYSNELYTRAVAKPLMACGDDNNQNDARLWYAGGDDNHGTIYRNDAPVSKFQGDLLNIELGPGRGNGYNTGFKDYSYVTPTLFIRRAREQVQERWNASVDISKVTVNAQFIEGVYTTLWLGVELKQAQDRIYIRNRADLYGLIVEIRDAQEPSKLLDPLGGDTAAGTRLVTWERYGAANQNWMVEPGATDELGGYMHVFCAMHAKGLSTCLNEAGGATPSTAPSNTVQLYPYDATRASEWWAHDFGDGVTYLFCDGTGRNLDRANGLHADGNPVQAYSSGWCDQWDNEANRWRIAEVAFKGAIELPPDPLREGSTARCPDPRLLCTPRKYRDERDEGLEYIYRWYASEGGRAVPGDPGQVVGQAHVSDVGDTPEAPAHGHVGLPHLGKAAAVAGRDANCLESFRLILDGFAHPGGIAYETDRGDAGADGSWCGPTGASHRFGGVRVWLTGEAARHADLAYRVFRTGSGWSDTVYSAGEGDAPLAGGAWEENRSVRGLWVMPVPKPEGAAVVREFSTDPSYTVRAADLEGLGFRPGFLSCAVMLSITGLDRGNERVCTDRYRGAVVTSAQPLSLNSTVTCFADGEKVGSFEYRNGTAPAVPGEIAEAASREGCTSWHGWFSDAACEAAWAPAPREGDFSIYSYNIVTLDFEPTDDSIPLDGDFRERPDAASPGAVTVPAARELRWGREARLALPPACFRDDGDGRWATCRPQGYFGTAAGTGAASLAVAPKRDTTLYIRWSEAVADGVEAMLAT